MPAASLPGGRPHRCAGLPRLPLVLPGTTANIVAPVATDTPELPPIRRGIRPEGVAALTAFLPSPEADASTGEQFVVGGGTSLRRHAAATAAAPRRAVDGRAPAPP